MDENYSGLPTDGSPWEMEGDTRYRALRGGSWYFNSNNCRSAYRARGTPDYRSAAVGFRVVVSARTP